MDRIQFWQQIGPSVKFTIPEIKDEKKRGLKKVLFSGTLTWCFVIPVSPEHVKKYVWAFLKLWWLFPFWTCKIIEQLVPAKAGYFLLFIILILGTLLIELVLRPINWLPNFEIFFYILLFLSSSRRDNWIRNDRGCWRIRP